MDKLYWYRAEVVDVYDGDSCRVFIDAGFGITLKGEDGKGVALRWFGINTPEIRGGTEETKAKAREARDFVRDRILNKRVLIHTIRDKSGKYGRLLAEVFELDDDGNAGEVSLNQQLVDADLAVVYMA